MRVGQIVGSFFDRVFARVSVHKSSISKKTGQPLFDVTGIGFAGDATGAKGETRDAQEAYMSGGILFRPPVPEKGEDLFLEALAARTSDGLVPFAFRDKRIIERINRGGGVAPKEGQILYAGYGGGFLSFELNPSEVRDQAQFYIPYARDGAGVPTKAHRIVMGKDGSGKPLLSVISGEGPRLILLDDTGTLFNADGTAWVELGPNGVGITGNTKIYGGVDVGSPSFPLTKYIELAAYVVALDAHVSAMSALLNIAGPVAGAAGALTAPAAAQVAASATFAATGSTTMLKAL
jgi:hypothetical protein